MFEWLGRLLGHSRERAPASGERSEQLSQPTPAAPPGPATESPDIPDPADGVVLRVPVLDSGLNLIGYEFSLRTELKARVRGGQRVRAFLNELLVERIAAAGGSWRSRRRAFLKIADEFACHPVLQRLAGGGVTLILTPADPAVPPPALLQQRLPELKAQGFEIALDDCWNTPWFDALAGQADAFTLAVARHSPAELQHRCERLWEQWLVTPLIAREVPTMDDLLLARKLGFRQFSGNFSEDRSGWSANRLRPAALRVSVALARLREGAEVRELAGLLKQDAALSYRLLRYVNAAAWGVNQPITVIEHAMILLGQQKLYRWLTLLLMAGGAQSPLERARSEAALLRARFMELLGSGLAPEQRDELFVLGLFSLLDQVMQVPLERMLPDLPMSAPMRQALVEGRGLYAPYLALARAWDEGDLPGISAACQQLDVDRVRADRYHLDALDWVLSSQVEAQEG